jgi:hypothetical protein
VHAETLHDFKFQAQAHLAAQFASSQHVILPHATETFLIDGHALAYRAYFA